MEKQNINAEYLLIAEHLSITKLSNVEHPTATEYISPKTYITQQFFNSWELGQLMNLINRTPGIYFFTGEGKSTFLNGVIFPELRSTCLKPSEEENEYELLRYKHYDLVYSYGMNDEDLIRLIARYKPVVILCREAVNAIEFRQVISNDFALCPDIDFHKDCINYLKKLANKNEFLLR